MDNRIRAWKDGFISLVSNVRELQTSRHRMLIFLKGWIRPVVITRKMSSRKRKQANRTRKDA